MPLPLLAIQAVLLAGAVTLLLLGGIAWRRRASAPAARPFALLMLCGFVYGAAYAGEIGQVQPGLALAWLHGEYLAIPWIPALWAWTALEQAGNSPRRGLLGALFGVPLVTFLGFQVPAWHPLFYRSFTLVPAGPLHLAQAGRGILYWLHIAFSYGAFLVAFAVCLASLRGAPRVFRRQALAMLGGSLAPFAALTLLVLRWTPGGLDPVPFATIVSGVLFFAGIFRYDLFDLVPVARGRVLEDMRDGVLVMDPAGRLIDLNPAARDLLAGQAEVTIGQPIAACLGSQPDLVAAIQGEGIRDCALPPAPGQAPGSGRHLAVRAFPLRHRGRVVGHAAILADITERVRLLAEVRRLADSDPLTGLGNRRRFRAAVGQEIRRSARKGTPFAVLLLDVDHFKRVNDRFGHAAGDAALQALARRVLEVLRATDLLVRLGGEEFVVLLPDSDAPTALQVAERIRAALAATPVAAGGRSVAVTLSIGVAVHPGGPGAEEETLLAAADRAMYRAKAEGRNRVRLMEAGSAVAGQAAPT